jgi:acyl-CoA thioesterase-1
MSSELELARVPLIVHKEGAFVPNKIMRWIIRLLVALVLAVFLMRGCSRKVSIPSGTIVFLGDSITAGYGLDPAQAYPSLIEIRGMTMLNLGVSGSQSDDGLQRLKDYFSSGGNPRLVVIALGANDILHGVSPGDTEANLDAAIQECKRRDIPVLLCGIRIPGKFGTDSIFQNVAGKNHVPLLPDLLQGEQNQEDLLQDDGHPNAAGQVIIAQKMQAALLQSFSFGK